MNAWPIIQTRLRQSGRQLLMAAALLIVLVGGGGMNAVDANGPQATEAMQLHVAARAEVEFDRVVMIVRDHRPGASPAWLHTLASAIVNEARAEAIDPLLVASIVARESSFRSRVVSSAGAVGLMQLRPWVAQAMAETSDVEWGGVETLHTPHLNVRLGVRYFKQLVERFGNERIALTAYCYGPTRVSSQVRNGTFRDSRYAQEILDLYREFNRDMTA